jgi:hypothetical protein
MYHTSVHGSTTRFLSERKKIDAKCQFRFPQGGIKLPLQKQFPAPLFVMYNKVRRYEMVILLFGYFKMLYQLTA